jgi:peptidoglycan/xylan/chitin deacetylase (PgdA/CDA1 family)
MIVVVSIGVVVVALSSCSHVELPGNRPVAATGYLPNEPLPPTQFEWPQDKAVGVSLSFDDARASQLDVGVPLLDSFGVKATFYVSIMPMRARLSDWKAVLATGHEIGNHSMRHACTDNFPFSKGKALEDYTLEQMAAELDQANAEIEHSLGVRPVTFAYPCGQKFVGRGVNVKSYVPLVASRFLAGRGWRDEAPTAPAVCDLAQLMTMELDGLTWEQLKVLIEQARKTGGWLVLCGHDIGEGGRQTTRIDTLLAFCKYAQDPKNGVWVDTVAKIGRYVAEQRSATGRRPAKPVATR